MTFSPFVARLALIIRIFSSRYVCDMVKRRRAEEAPNVINRASPMEWSGSLPVIANGSWKTDAASKKEILCFFSFFFALAESHSICIRKPIVAFDSYDTRYSSKELLVMLSWKRTRTPYIFAPDHKDSTKRVVPQK